MTSIFAHHAAYPGEAPSSSVRSVIACLRAPRNGSTSTQSFPYDVIDRILPSLFVRFVGLAIPFLVLAGHAEAAESQGDVVRAATFTLLTGVMPAIRAVVVRADSLPPQGTGDSTNTDVPRWYPPSKVNRLGVSERQPKLRVAPLPPAMRTIGEVDSLLNSMRLRDRLDGIDVGQDVPMDLDEYLALRREQLVSKLRDSSLFRYELKKPLTDGELAKLIDQATNITIPIPPNPLMGIFGKPEISINVNGEVNVQAGWRWDTQSLGTASVLGQTQSAPIFNQNIQVNVGARIGDKFRLNVDWNTLNQFEFNNRFKVGYEGYDDDIIKRVEFGNVNLETPSTLIGGGQTLFGVRADFQFGPLMLKTIASQRRGERRFANVRGGSSRTFFQVRAYDYARNHFFLDTAYFQVWREYFRSPTPTLSPNFNQLVVKGDVEVWESTPDNRDVTANDAVAIADLEGIPTGTRYPDAYKSREIRAGFVERGRFTKLQQNRFEVDLNLGTLTIFNLRPDRYYAVAYRTDGVTTAPTDDVQHGTLTNTVGEKDTLILKLVARPQMQPGFPVIWRRMMRNRYNIGLNNVNTADARIGMWYYRNTNDSTDVLEGAPDKIMTIFRIDQVNNGTGQAPPDGLLDPRPPIFNSARGEITFPSLEPFRDGLREYFASKGNPQLAEQYVFNEVYDTTEVTARLNSAKDRFIITGEASGSSSGSNRIPLAYNTAPGSVTVTLDGAPLREGVDYTVDYYSGTLTLMNARATMPQANLNISYEQNDIFNLTTRTLAGIRADYQLYNKRKTSAFLGMTLMNYDQAAVIDRVPPGQEPNANLMFGFDGKFTSQLDWLTRAIDELPIIDTKTPSSFNIQGEWAMVAPEPNKRISTVASDNLKAVAYLDDFENARRQINFGMTPTVWRHSSPLKDSTLWEHDTIAAKFRGRNFWYQRFVPDVPQADVYPNRARVQGRQNIPVLRIAFEPDRRGIYNDNPEFVDDNNPTWNGSDSLLVRSNVAAFQSQNRDRIWAGMTRLLSPFNTNFDQDNNVDFIEVMMKIDEYEPGKSKMYIDLGQISEDIIPNQQLNTEDRVPQNNLIDAGEDIGIDTLDNAAEKIRYPFPLNLEDDPARDDYFFDFLGDRQNQPEQLFVRYNNFEGNATQAESGQVPDKEILNENNGQTISLDNSYFRYEINLDPNPNTNPQIVGGNPATRWFLYRIPIRRPDTTVGNPLFTNIQYVRAAFRGGTVKVAIADWGVVGSYWLRRHNLEPRGTEEDSVLAVTYINREENAGPPDFYSMPPGVQAPQQLQNPDPYQAIFFNEQSLVVRVTNLRPGEERMSARIYRPWDLFFYRELAFFLHGDQTMPDRVVAGSTPPAYAYIRFGVDSANYYEYRRPLLRGWQDLRIIMSELTAIKQVRDQARINERQEFPVPGDPTAIFAIKGSPILTRVTFFGFGIANPIERFPNELSTSMWANELRLVDPVNTNDWAAVGNMNLKLADLADVTASISHTNPNFHRLEERFGNRNMITQWNVTVNATMEKFLPRELKDTKIPITYTHSELAESPQFQAQNDVELERAAEAARTDTLAKGASIAEANKVYDNVRSRSQRVEVRDQWGITGLRLGIPTKLWWLDDTFNKLTFNFDYSQLFQRTQVVQNRFEWRWRFRADYNVTVPSKYDVSPLKFLDGVFGLKAYKDMKINFLPQNIVAGVNMTRMRTTEQSRFLPFPSPIVREFLAEKNFGFNWRLVENGFLSPTIDYKVTAISTLANMELDENGRQRSGNELFSRMFFTNGLVDFGQESDYKQTVTISMRPKLPDILGLNRLIETTGSYTVNYNLFDPLQPDPRQRDVVRTARYTSSFRMSPIVRWRQIGNGIFGTPQKGKTEDGTLETIGRVVQEIFFGFENLTIQYNQTGNAANNGVLGGTGFTNFWARTLTGRGTDPIWGPSTAYQLGLVSNPHGGISIEPSSRFPFFSFASSVGVRPPNAVMTDDFNQKNTFQIQTSRPLWTGATLDLVMKSDWGFTRNQRVVTDAQGIPTFTNINVRQTLDRTFMSFPTWFTFGLSNDGVDEVVRLYNERKAVIDANVQDTAQKNQQLLDALATSFRQGFESGQLWTGELARIMPALNWTIRWDGIEKIGVFKGIATRVYLEHGYQSTYQENARINDNGRIIEVQQVKTGFQPLVGLNMNFDEKALKGNLTATVRYNLTESHSLNASARATISKETSHELQINASYLRRGVSLKFLGIDLQNDMEFSFLTQIRRSLQGRFDVVDYKPDADVVQGTTNIVIEPRARYTISNRVTASAFVRYEGNFSEGAANPGYSTTQVGVDIRLSISGGR